MTSVDGSRSFKTIILKQTLCPVGASKCPVCPHSITLWAAFTSAQVSQGSKQMGPVASLFSYNRYALFTPVFLSPCQEAAPEFLLSKAEYPFQILYSGQWDVSKCKTGTLNVFEEEDLPSCISWMAQW